MPHRIGFLYEKMCNKELIRQAILKGSKYKRSRWDIRRILSRIDHYTDRIFDMLIHHAYVPNAPKARVIYDGVCRKKRIIHIVPFFPDGVIQQLCVMVMSQVLERGMYHWSCASIPGRGNARARKYVRRVLDRDAQGTKYCLKMDVRKFYPSVPVDRLIESLRRKIKDETFLNVVHDIVASNPDGGLAIGYYINQWLANYYLEPLDNYILTLPGVGYYVRNMDDMVLLGDDKKRLHEARAKIECFLNAHLLLDLKHDWQVFPVDARGIDFVGYRFYHAYTTLRRRNFLRLIRQCRRVKRNMAKGKIISVHQAAGLISRIGQLKHCDSRIVRKKYILPLDLETLKTIIRIDSKSKAARGNSFSLAAA